MKVKLITMTNNPVAAVAAAARRCYSGLGNNEMFDFMAGKLDEDAEYLEKFIRKVLASGHDGILEAASFTFAIEGVSRALSHQLVRHRAGCSFAQQSQRYVENAFGGEWYIVPASIAEKPEALTLYKSLMDRVALYYGMFLEMGIPKEDARYVLPNATETKLIVTMNARALLHFFRLRCCNRSQWEIRALAEAMLKEAQRVAGVLFEKGGAPCEHGPCPEGAMSCKSPKKGGRHIEANGLESYVGPCDAL